MKKNFLEEAMEGVMDFRSEAILLALQGEKPSNYMFDTARQHCKTLAEADVYSFDIEASNTELLRQIQQFHECSM